MTFWTDAVNFQPNIKNRFLVQLALLGDQGMYSAKSVEPLPSFDTELIGGEMNQDGTGFDPYNKAAVVKWKPITVTFANVAYDPNQDNLLYKLIQSFFNAGYNPPDGIGPAIGNNISGPTIGVNDDNPASILVNNSYLSQLISGVVIYTLRPDGTKTSEYELINPVITGINIDGTNYDTDEIHTFSLTINYSYAMFRSVYCN